MSFPQNLQYIRNRAGLTQEQMAEHLNISRQSVSKWESGASFPEMETLLHICDSYHVTLDMLLRGNVEAESQQDTIGYDTFMNGFIRRVTFSVGAIIAGVSLLILLITFGVHEMIATALFLLIITVSVVVLIASGIEEDHFRKRHPVIADFYTDEEKDAFHRRFIWYIAGGTGAILFGVVMLVLFFAFFPEQEPYESLAAALLLLIISGSVMSFTYGCMQEEKYLIWKYNRDNSPAPEAKKRLGLINSIRGCIMLLATAIYVGLGISKTAWDTAWWLFPVGGILCAVVGVILNPYRNDDN